MKKLIIIRNGRGVVAEGEDVNQLREAFDKVVANHKERDVKLEHALPAFDTIKRCDHESSTGMLCMLDTAESPNASKSYYQVGFVD